MPEGDTIHRTAARLDAESRGMRILSIGGYERDFQSSHLEQLTITSVQARGKHLLMHVSDERVIHSHMGMSGSWHIYATGERWRKPGRMAALSFELTASSEETMQKQIVCFSPKQLELLTPTALRRHRWISRLGPDLLAEPFLESFTAEGLRRFRIHNPTVVGEAVMNQTIVAGIGNVYKSEILFLLNINPFTPVQTLTDEQVLQIMQRGRKLLKRNLTGGPRRTRFGHDGPKTWVYERQGEPCLRCGQHVQMQRQGDLGRSTYWCPNCQS